MCMCVCDHESRALGRHEVQTWKKGREALFSAVLTSLDSGKIKCAHVKKILPWRLCVFQGHCERTR